MLSEKSQGKQRAADPPPEVSAEIQTRELIIRFTEGIQDLTVFIGEHDAVRDVKIKVSMP